MTTIQPTDYKNIVFARNTKVDYADKNTNPIIKCIFKQYDKDMNGEFNDAEWKAYKDEIKNIEKRKANLKETKSSNKLEQKYRKKEDKSWQKIEKCGIEFAKLDFSCFDKLVEFEDKHPEIIRKGVLKESDIPKDGYKFDISFFEMGIYDENEQCFTGKMCQYGYIDGLEKLNSEDRKEYIDLLKTVENVLKKRSEILAKQDTFRQEADKYHALADMAKCGMLNQEQSFDEEQSYEQYVNIRTNANPFYKEIKELELKAEKLRLKGIQTQHDADLYNQYTTQIWQLMEASRAWSLSDSSIDYSCNNNNKKNSEFNVDYINKQIENIKKQINQLENNPSENDKQVFSKYSLAELKEQLEYLENFKKQLYAEPIADINVKINETIKVDTNPSENHKESKLSPSTNVSLNYNSNNLSLCGNAEREFDSSFKPKSTNYSLNGSYNLGAYKLNGNINNSSYKDMSSFNASVGLGYKNFSLNMNKNLYTMTNSETKKVETTKSNGLNLSYFDRKANANLDVTLSDNTTTVNFNSGYSFKAKTNNFTFNAKPTLGFMYNGMKSENDIFENYNLTPGFEGSINYQNSKNNISASLSANISDVMDLKGKNDIRMTFGAQTSYKNATLTANYNYTNSSFERSNTYGATFNYRANQDIDLNVSYSYKKNENKSDELSLPTNEHTLTFGGTIKLKPKKHKEPVENKEDVLTCNSNKKNPQTTNTLNDIKIPEFTKPIKLPEILTENKFFKLING